MICSLFLVHIVKELQCASAKWVTVKWASVSEESSQDALFSNMLVVVLSLLSLSRLAKSLILVIIL